MGIEVGKRVSFEEVFDEKVEDISLYLNGIGEKDLFKVVPALISASNPNHEHNPAESLVKMWFNENNHEIQGQILDKLKSTDRIVNITSSLHLLEYILKNKLNEESVISTNDIEINIFKAYLALNSMQSSKESNNELPEAGTHQEDFIYAYFLSIGFHDYDLVNFNINELTVLQLIKSIEFFKYLERTESLHPHLSFFLHQFGYTTWGEWVYKIICIIFPIVQKVAKSFQDYRLEKDKYYDSNQAFFDSMCSNLNDEKIKSDFVLVRSSPILKIGEDNYRIISTLFLVEKLFKSLQFQFSLSINNQVPKESIIKDFRSRHCDNFSERTLLYKTIERCFPKNGFKLISGDDFVSENYSAEPDYYVRFKNKIFLFESKDVILTGEQKQSHQYSTLCAALKKKFYKIDHPKKTEPKAILQLINNVVRVYQKYYDKLDSNYDPKSIVIYPIIVTHDRQFDAPGINKIVAKWFREELKASKIEINFTNVKDPTIINIDTLLMNQKVFKSRGRYRLEKYLVDFHNYTNIEFPVISKSLNSLSSSMISFSDFMIDRTPNNIRGQLLPEITKEVKNMLPSYVTDN